MPIHDCSTSLTLRLALHEGAATAARWWSLKTRQTRIKFRHTPGVQGPNVSARPARLTCLFLLYAQMKRLMLILVAPLWIGRAPRQPARCLLCGARSLVRLAHAVNGLLARPQRLQKSRLGLSYGKDTSESAESKIRKVANAKEVHRRHAARAVGRFNGQDTIASRTAKSCAGCQSHERAC